jgi:hypothetical protein
MANPADANASREEEIAFLAMEQVLRVDIELADAGAGDRMPDGAWAYADGRRAIVEITSPPAAALLADWALAKRNGKPQVEGGCVPLLWNGLAGWCESLLSQSWARENVNKLCRHVADERHLFLFARSHADATYFYRLAEAWDEGTRERVAALALPVGISDVWFRGRAMRPGHQILGTTHIRLARFQRDVGWSSHRVSVEECQLPTPNPGIADDPVPHSTRTPKSRAAPART